MKKYTVVRKGNLFVLKKRYGIFYFETGLVFEQYARRSAEAFAKEQNACIHDKYFLFFDRYYGDFK